MPEEKTILIYKFKELKKEVKDKVIEKERNYRYEDSYITELIDEDIQYWLNENCIPFDNKSICFDLSCYKSHPYISWNGKFDKSNIETFLKNNRMFKRFKDLFKHHIYLKIDNCREGYLINFEFDSEFYFNDYDDDVRKVIIEKETNKLNALFEEFKTYMENRIEEIRKDITKKAEDSYNSYFSDESIIEDINCNDYDFLENGSRW